MRPASTGKSEIFCGLARKRPSTAEAATKTHHTDAETRKKLAANCTEVPHLVTVRFRSISLASSFPFRYFICGPVHVNNSVAGGGHPAQVLNGGTVTRRPWMDRRCSSVRLIKVSWFRTSLRDCFMCSFSFGRTGRRLGFILKKFRRHSEFT